MNSITGAAKRYVTGSDRAFRGGVVLLMDHLRKALGKPRVNEVTDLRATYFKGTRRKNGESMNEYITRKTEAYMRASQALKRVQPHYEKEAAGTTTTNDGGCRWPSTDHGGAGWGRQWTPASETDGSSGHEDTASSTRPFLGSPGRARAEPDGLEYWVPLGLVLWLAELGPVGLVYFVFGGKVQRSRAMVLAHGRESYEMDEDFEDAPEDLEAEGLNDEGIALVVDGADGSGCAGGPAGGRTLKHAQKMVKQNRKYYQGGNVATETINHGTTATSNAKKGHRVANCPNKKMAAGATAVEPTEHQAPFVCFSEQADAFPDQLEENFAGFAHQQDTSSIQEALSTENENEGISTAKAVKRGLCVVDGGATQTIGSVAASLRRGLRESPELLLRQQLYQSMPEHS